MANAIRVSDGNRWAYVPAETEHQARLERLAAAGMAEVSDGFVLLRHEAGPMFWDMLDQSSSQSNSKAILSLAEKMFEGGGVLPLSSNEGIKLGKSDNALSYNKFADLSLVKGSFTRPAELFSSFEDGHVVMTVWPENKRIVPARISVGKDQRYSLELPESQKKGERCFILDGCDLITVSFPSDGSDKVQAMNPNVLMSWLVSADSESTKKMSGRYGIEHQDAGQFLIRDKKSGKAYAGAILASPTEAEKFEFEKSRLERLLASKGLGAILAMYVLRNA